MKAYSALAGSYEYLQRDYDYEKWSQYLIKNLKSLPNNKGVDVGAGTGIITRALNNAGFDVCGTDVSVEMLNTAISLSKGIPFYLQSADKFSGFKGLGFVTAVNDVVNYLTAKKAMEFFSRVYKALANGGTFIFDISSKYKLEKVLKNNTFTCEDEDVSYIWHNTLLNKKVRMELTVFTKNDDGTYERREENHLQYVHTKDYLLKELKSVGFTVEVYADFGKKIQQDSQRLHFICRK
jgi:predicted TPR repeat methyltransferase